MNEKYVIVDKKIIAKCVVKCFVCGKTLLPEEPCLADFPICVYCYKDMVKKTLSHGIRKLPQLVIDHIATEHIDFLIHANELEIKEIMDKMKLRKS